MSLIIEYIGIYEEQVKKYGERLVLLMQVGSFYECYSTSERGPNLEEISNLLNIILTRRDKSITEISEKNPKLIGFPCISLQKNLKLLIDNRYTVVVIDQVTPPPNPVRKITGVFSPSTYIEEVKDVNNYLIAIYIQDEKQLGFSKSLKCIGLTAIDLNIGKIILEEHHSSLNDENSALNQIKESVYKYNPKEILIFGKGLEDELTGLSVKNIPEIDASYHRISYQTAFLEKIFGSNGFINVFEYLELETKPYCTLSLMIALNFCYLQNESILKGISKPIFGSTNHLHFGNNTVNCLSLLDEKGLYSIIDFTRTVMGKRLLKERLLYPETNVDIINKRYNLIEKIRNEDLNLKDELEGIKDLERYLRRIQLKTLHPYELYNIYDSLIRVQNLGIKVKDILSYKDFFSDFKGLKTFEEYISSRFNQDLLVKYNLKDILQNFYKENVHTDIEKLEEKIDIGSDLVHKLIQSLNNLVKEDLKLEVKNNKKEGQYLVTTKKRGEKLENILSENEILHLGSEGNRVRIRDLVISHTKTTTKIKIPKLASNHTDNNFLQIQISNLVRDKYLTDLDYIESHFKDIIMDSICFISELDFLNCGSIVSKKYNYFKPEIVLNSEESFVNFQNLRHPIIERIIDHTFVPHSLEIGKNQKGILLYGLNSSGKSSLQKSIGMSLILAQMGYYVPATKFQYYPYKYILTRIDGNDNLFKGLSSFSLEMNDLKNILNYAGKNTMIIGDEVCKGTEYLSANSILAATIVTLSKSESTFIFATHLHDIPKISFIKELNNVKCYHLHVELDRKTGELIFNRNLLPGQGEEVYGILVASNIIGDSNFIELTNKVKCELMEIPDSVLRNKVSRYNQDIIIDHCGVCGKRDSAFDVHHINFQKNCEGSFVKDKPHIPKNGTMNLVVLCENCHQSLHKGEIFIGEKLATSKGKKIK